MIARLALEDGTVFRGNAVGATGTSAGEVVFNTAMTGYQEVFTDPSYCGQIVTMTFPLQGNYGVNEVDCESHGTHLAGVVLRELPRRPSNYRAQSSLQDYLVKQNIIGITGIDTRALTRRVREHGAMRGAISTELSEIDLVNFAQSIPKMAGSNLVHRVTPRINREWSEPLWSPAHDLNNAPPPRCHVVTIDCGIKHNILRHLVSAGCRVTDVSADAPVEQIRELQLDGILVSNGPGDPAALPELADTIRQLVGTCPILGICLGHQLLAHALGADTFKLPFGHHGANLPVLNRTTDQVEITSQNHGFAVETTSLERVGATITHVNLNDGTVEGFAHHDLGLTAIQFHPEASPGPHDASHAFNRFVGQVVGE